MYTVKSLLFLKNRQIRKIRHSSYLATYIYLHIPTYFLLAKPRKVTSIAMIWRVILGAEEPIAVASLPIWLGPTQYTTQAAEHRPFPSRLACCNVTLLCGNYFSVTLNMSLIQFTPQL